MRLFKTHRGQASQTNTPEVSSRGQSPARTSAYYPQDRQRPQFDNPEEHPAHRSNPPYDAGDFPRPIHQPSYSNDPTHPVPTDYAQPSVNIGPPPTIQGRQVQPGLQEISYQQVEEKEPKRSKRAYFGIQPTPRDQTPKLLGRSVSVRRREPPPQPSIDTSYSSRGHQQPQSAVEPRRQDFVFEPAPVEHHPVQPAPVQPAPIQPPPEQSQLRDYAALREQRRSQLSIAQSRESIIEENTTGPGSRTTTPTPTDSTRGYQNVYSSYQAPRSERNSLQAHDNSYLVRPVSQQSSIGPPSPLGVHRNTYIESNPEPPSPPSHVQGQEMMAREGQTSSSRSSAQTSHGHGHEQVQYPPHSSSSATPRPAGGQLAAANDPGRGTPPPNSKSREDLSQLEFPTLLQKHEELLGKYSKVKKYYFEKDAQVQQLQNAIAHQRLSMKNTALDDNEYQTRFNRLDGAINNFAFNIRKDWKAVPPWLQSVVNKDAAAVGTKEMTAAGRACITRWLVDEIFDRFFHPGLEPALSSQLKIIEKNIRRNILSKSSTEEAQKDDHNVKLSNWRLTTVEGLQDMLSSTQAQEYQTQLTAGLVEKLSASLQMNLNDPPPPGLDVGIFGIIELAVGIAANIPLESRDVAIEYFMPGAPITDIYMKMETTLPPLKEPGANNEFLLSGDQIDRSSPTSTGGDSLAERDQSAAGDSGYAGARDNREKKRSIFGLVNKKPAPGELATSNGPQANAEKEKEAARERELAEKNAAAERERRIRFSSFVTVEVRGKGKDTGNVLVKAPCYGY